MAWTLCWPHSSLLTNFITAKFLRVNIKIKKKFKDVKKQHFEVIVDNVYGITHSSCCFRRKGGNGHSKTASNTVSLYWLLALKFWFINSPSLLIYSISSRMIQFSSFQPSWGMNLFFFFQSLFLVESGKLLFHSVQTMHLILFHWMLVKWE